MRLSLLVLAVALAPAASGLSLPPLGESPPDRACDDERRVCAGFAADGAVTCGPTAAGARCAWSYGWLSRAWGPEGEPGSETHSGTVDVTQCSSVRGCVTLLSDGFEAGCAWLPLLACEDSRGAFRGETSFPLVMGECVVVGVDVRGSIAASAQGPLAPEAAHTRFARAGGDAGAVCLVDDGR